MAFDAYSGLVEPLGGGQEVRSEEGEACVANVVAQARQRP
jgi:hypothetical protein